ncbi:MAG: cytochrome c [Planctomycetota bacterium]|nr:cytochrome c [Planctomycetota bacterium]
MMRCVGTVRLVMLVVMAASVCVSAAGCRGDRTEKRPRQFFPGMDDQPKYKTQAKSDFFADGRTMREPVAGTVAFGRTASLTWGEDQEEQIEAERSIRRQRFALLGADPEVFTGQTAAGEYVERIPVHRVLGYDEGQAIPQSAMRDFLELGKKQYDIYCYTCHGATGDGRGPVGAQWSGAGPAVLTQERLAPGGENGQDGYMFSIGYFGLPNAPGVLPAWRMQGYRGQVDEYEMWAIVAYIRALQRSQSASIADVPEQQRQELRRTMPAGGGAGEGQGE